MSFEKNILQSNNEKTQEQGIEAIESINTGTEQRAQMILVALGLKPATELSLYPWNSTAEEAEVLLGKTNLFWSKKDHKNEEKTTAEYAIARDQATLQKILAPTNSEQYGLLMGYPDTAVAAFERGDTYEGVLPEDIEKSIFKMKFSKDHFEEEFETIRKWNAALQKAAPNLLG